MIYILFFILSLLVTEVLSWSFTLIFQQKCIKLLSNNDKMLVYKYNKISYFTISNIIVTMYTYMFTIWYTLLFSNLQFVVVLNLLIYCILNIYLLHFISKCIHLPYEYFPLFSKQLLHKSSKIVNIENVLPDQYSINHSLLENFLNVIPDMFQIKDINNKFAYVNKSIQDNLLLNDKIDIINKTSTEIAQSIRERGINYTFGELCCDSDEITKSNNKLSLFFEYGMVNNKMVALHVIKTPIYNNNVMVGTMGIARDISAIIEQQKKIEKLFIEGNKDDGIGEFFKYHQRFKNMIYL